MSSTGGRRKTISLESDHLERIRSIRDTNSTAHAALRRAIGDREDSPAAGSGRTASESQVLRWLISLGLERVRDLELDVAYAQLARSHRSEDAAEDEAFLQLTAQAWADED